ncbi:MAG: Gfo/Idh/MocA family oxidoreductase [Acidobacteria bacterium]|nr:Gfo/Idh/MocA family oxidoreductase [Acidobacteriota bacterium]
METVRIAVIGTGSFGRNHLRVLRGLEGATLAAVVDADPARAAEAAATYECEAVATPAELAGKVDAAVVATPTLTHAAIGCALFEQGVDVLVEKPIAPDLASADRLIAAASRHGRILQVGHLERFNPAVAALRKIVRNPLFFEIHRMSLFSPRSLDVDVVLDLMIHDLDVVLTLTGRMPEEIRAAGISILSQKVDIANVRLAFPGGCVANLTASRVSTERIRKIRLFQPRQYLSLDYARQDLAAFEVSPEHQIGFHAVDVAKDEPLKLELASFVQAVQTRSAPEVTGEDARRALEVALEILDKIEAHARVVAQSMGVA